MRLVILGGGTAGWMAASMFARLMGNQLDISLIESEQIGTVGVGEATIPPILHFNKALGISESDFLSATKGTIKLGIEFCGWHSTRNEYMHAFGRIGKDMGLAAFHHTWLRAKQQGDTRDFWEFSLNYQAAKANKYQPLQQIPNTNLPGLVYAYHFDAGLYAAYLRQLSEQWGVRRIEGKVSRVNKSIHTGNIQELVLEQGQKVVGDFFIDCSGFRALLIEGALYTGYEDWRHWLPCDRAVAVQCEGEPPLLPYTKSIAREAGWQWRIPLQHRIGNGLVYCSDFVSDDQAQSQLLSQLDGKPVSEPNRISFVTGRRQQQWVKNCVALGLASGFLEPLESTSLHLVQSGLIRLIKFFPAKGEPQASMVSEYNRQSKLEFEQIRDFIILHYYLNDRPEPFWKACANMAIPDSLQQKIALFRQQGQVTRYLDELFTETAWQQVMIGQGVEPACYHPLADSLTSVQLRELLDSLQTLITGTINKLSLHQQFIDQITVANPSR